MVDNVNFFLVAVIVGIPVLGILIFVHELGHFLLAKLCRVGVIEFAIGFGKKLWSRRIGATRYSLRAVPLGGYVRMAGDDPSLVDREAKGALAVGEEATKGFSLEGQDDPEDEVERGIREDQSGWFLKKKFPAKAAVVLAGPLFNLLFAWILSVASYAWYGAYEHVDEPVIGAVMPNLPAEKAGLLENDRVLSLNGAPLQTWTELSESIHKSKGVELTLQVERRQAGDKVEIKEIKLKGEPENPELALLYKSPRDEPREPFYVVGIQPSSRAKAVSWGSAVELGTLHVAGVSVLTIRSLVLLVKGAISPKNIGGPISIMKVAAHSAVRGLERLLAFMIFLSVSLAVLNLLPIPVLDGGHLAIFVVELIIRRPLGLKAYEVANRIGMAFILGLMLFAIFNDIWQLVSAGG